MLDSYAVGVIFTKIFRIKTNIENAENGYSLFVYSSMILLCLYPSSISVCH